LEVEERGKFESRTRRANRWELEEEEEEAWGEDYL
jgi:hypothetical protein